MARFAPGLTADRPSAANCRAGRWRARRGGVV